MLMPSLMQLLDRRDALSGAGNLDHHIVAADCFPQPARLLDRALGVAREIRRYFEADVAVTTLRAFIHRPQNIRSVLDVANGENLVAPLGIEIGSRAAANSADRHTACCP